MPSRLQEQTSRCQPSPGSPSSNTWRLLGRTGQANSKIHLEMRKTKGTFSSCFHAGYEPLNGFHRQQRTAAHSSNPTEPVQQLTSYVPQHTHASALLFENTLGAEWTSPAISAKTSSSFPKDRVLSCPLFTEKRGSERTELKIPVELKSGLEVQPRSSKSHARLKKLSAHGLKASRIPTGQRTIELWLGALGLTQLPKLQEKLEAEPASHQTYRRLGHPVGLTEQLRKPTICPLGGSKAALKSQTGPWLCHVHSTDRNPCLANCVPGPSPGTGDAQQNPQDSCSPGANTGGSYM